MRSLSSIQASEGSADGECMSTPYAWTLITKLYYDINCMIIVPTRKSFNEMVVLVVVVLVVV